VFLLNRAVTASSYSLKIPKDCHRKGCSMLNAAFVLFDTF